MELAAYIVNECFAAIEIDVIAVAGIVELCVIVSCAYRCADFLYQSKTGNGISVFFCNISSLSGRSVRMVQPIPNVIDCLFGRFAGQNLDIVIGGLTAITRLGAIEVSAIQRHSVNVCLPRAIGHIGVDTPCSAGPFIRNVCIHLCFDGMLQFQAVIRMSVFLLPAH